MSISYSSIPIRVDGLLKPLCVNEGFKVFSLHVQKDLMK